MMAATNNWNNWTHNKELRQDKLNSDNSICKPSIHPITRERRIEGDKSEQPHSVFRYIARNAIHSHVLHGYSQIEQDLAGG